MEAKHPYIRVTLHAEQHRHYTRVMVCFAQALTHSTMELGAGTSWDVHGSTAVLTGTRAAQDLLDRSRCILMQQEARLQAVNSP